MCLNLVESDISKTINLKQLFYRGRMIESMMVFYGQNVLACTPTTPIRKLGYMPKMFAPNPNPN